MTAYRSIMLLISSAMTGSCSVAIPHSRHQEIMRMRFRAKRDLRRGFSLIEMLAVIAIMLIIMGTAIVSLSGFGARTAMKGAVVSVKSGLALTRQWAVTHRTRTVFTYGNTNLPGDIALSARGWFVITNLHGEYIGDTNFLPVGVIFTNDEPAVLEFMLDGHCEGGGTSKTIAIKNKMATNYITVYPETGRAMSDDH